MHGASLLASSGLMEVIECHWKLLVVAETRFLAAIISHSVSSDSKWSIGQQMFGTGGFCVAEPGCGLISGKPSSGWHC